MRRRAGAATCVLAALAFTAACSDNGGLSSLEREYADAFARDLADEEDGFGVDAEAGDCIAEVIMGELGSEPFEDAGVEPEDLAGDDAPGELLGSGVVTDEQADAIVDGWHGCADLPGAFAAQARDEFGLDDAGVACLAEALRDDGALDRYIHVSFTSDRPADAETALADIVTLVQQCTAGEGGGGILVDSIAAELAAGGQLTAEQARCVAQHVVDAVGAARLIEITGAGTFETAPPEIQDEFAGAIIDAAAVCGIPATALDG